MAQMDYLTDIYDRQTIEDIVSEKIANKEFFSFAILDIDNFKDINDTYGHQFGDVVIKKVATSIVNSLGEEGTVGRLGGDEFVIVINEVNDFQIRQICSNIRNQISFLFNSSHFVLSASIGVNRFPKDSKTYEELFKKSDKCLYIAKRKGKNRYIIYDEQKHGSNETIIYDPLVNSKDKFSEAILAADIVHNLIPFDDTNAIRPVLNQVHTFFGIDRISVYFTDKLDLLYSVGKVLETDNAQYVFENSYLSNFNIRNVCIFENIPFLSSNNEKAYVYNIFKERDVKSVFQYIVTNNGKVIGLISFENMRNSKIFTNSEITGFTLSSILIADTLINVYKKKNK